MCFKGKVKHALELISCPLFVCLEHNLFYIFLKKEIHLRVVHVGVSREIRYGI